MSYRSSLRFLCATTVLILVSGPFAPHALPAAARPSALAVDPVLSAAIERALNAYRHFDCLTIAEMAPPMEPDGFRRAYALCAQGARGWKATGVKTQHVLKRGAGAFASQRWGRPYGTTLVYNQPVRFAQFYKGQLEVFDRIVLFVKIGKAWYDYGLLMKPVTNAVPDAMSVVKPVAT